MLGNRESVISIYAIILLTVVLLFFPVQQVYGFFTLPPELNEDQLIELYKLEQLVKAEQARDENFVSQMQQNPYFDTPPNVIISFKENIEEKSLDQRNENFQLIKDEQISIAEKKCKEILRAETILNSIDNESVNKKSIHKFRIDNQTGFMNRNLDDFENYRLLQISIAEDFRDNNWKENLWKSNPYQNNESIKVLYINEENKNFKLYWNDRQSEEFKNLTIEQIHLAENIRNEVLEFRMLGNPYMDENIDESLGKTNTKIIVTDLSDLTYVTDKLDFNNIDRNDEGFEVTKTVELEIAQNTLNGMLMLSSLDEDDEEIIISINENKKPNNYERDDQGFEFFKNKQIVMAEKKLMEILGQKNIHNSDY